MTAETAAHAFRAALYAAALNLWAGTPVQVILGNPATYQADDVVEIGAVNSTQDPATFGSQRSREEQLELEVIISIFRAGGIEREADVFDRAYALLEDLALFCRVTDTTVGGTVRQCALTSNAYGSGNSDQTLAAGRIGVVVAKFTAQARIRT